MALTFEEAVYAVRARPLVARNGPAHVVISTDTRTLRSGEVFLALRGERFDGHHYVEAAVRHGAAAVVVERQPATALDVPVLLVEDTRAAYMRLAAAARAKTRATVIAITGSTGKTTTKELLGQLLRRTYGERVALSPANENNEIGVSKLFLSVPPNAQVVVAEMGARHYGDIATLVDIARPDVGILTNVREAHLEIMQTQERLAQTKWALFSTGARAVLNAGDAVSRERAAELPESPRWFGTGSVRPPEHQQTKGVYFLDRRRLRLIDDGRDELHAVDVRLPGDHNVENLAAAIAGALEAHCSPSEVLAGLADLELPAGRYESFLIPDRARIIFDAYNASASGTIATLDAFRAEKARRRIAVLASMAELGSSAPQLHRDVGAYAARSGVDLLLVGGDHADELRGGAQGGGLRAEQIIDFRTTGEAAGWIRENTTPDDVVLLKGSRRYKLEEIVEQLQR